MRCKPGDLAVIVEGSEVFSENLGAFVTVHKEHTEASRYFGMHMWNVSSAAPLRRLDGLALGYGLVPDCCLQPIRPAPEKQTRDEEITA